VLPGIQGKSAPVRTVEETISVNWTYNPVFGTKYSLGSFRIYKFTINYNCSSSSMALQPSWAMAAFSVP
jgi:hypothetical protein